MIYGTRIRSWALTKYKPYEWRNLCSVYDVREISNNHYHSIFLAQCISAISWYAYATSSSFIKNTERVNNNTEMRNIVKIPPNINIFLRTRMNEVSNSNKSSPATTITISCFFLCSLCVKKTLFLFKCLIDSICMFLQVCEVGGRWEPPAAAATQRPGSCWAMAEAGACLSHGAYLPSRRS